MIIAKNNYDNALKASFFNEFVLPNIPSIDYVVVYNEKDQKGLQGGSKVYKQQSKEKVAEARV